MSPYAIFILIGTILVILSYAFTKDTIYLIRHGEKTTATITRIEEVDFDDTPSYSRILSFTTIDGKNKEYKCNYESILPTTSVGGEVPVVYDPHNPSEMKVLTYLGAFAPAIIMGTIAAGFLFLGIGYFVAQTILR
jgi:hypothetical protein